MRGFAKTIGSLFENRSLRPGARQSLRLATEHACLHPRGQWEPRLAGYRKGAGQVMMLTALSLVVLIGFVALATDLGLLWTQRRQMQNAADAAAVAGAHAKDTQSDVVSAAQLDASRNGFTNGSKGVTVTVYNPPVAGTYAGDSDSVEAIIRQREPTYFLRVLNISSVVVQARAVARMSARDCIYVMDPAASSAFSVNGTANLQVNCGIAVNSSSSSAFVTNGGGCVTASSISVTGGDALGSCPPSPTPKTGVPPVPDPLAWAQPPAVGACDHTNFSVTAKRTTTLNPGVYCNGITITGNGNTAVLNPGTYILNGGGLNVHGGADVQGAGVTFYNTQGAYAYAPIQITGGNNTALSAPASGPLPGILFFEDRNITSSEQNVVAGGTSNKFEGALYFLNSPLQFAGNSSGVSPYTVIVAGTLQITGTSYVGHDYTSLYDATSPARETAVLGE